MLLFNAPRFLIRFSEFCKSSTGNIAIMAGLLVMPLVGFSGLAVDYSITSMQRAKLASLADATALLGTARAKSIIEKKEGRVSGRLDGLEGHLIKHFNAEAKKILPASATIEVTQKGLEVTVNVSWQTDVPSVFGKVYGVRSYDIAGKSQSVTSLKPHIQLLVLLDVSQSMGIGATVEAQKQLFNLEKCMFACHVPAAFSMNDPTKTTYESARAAKIDTRIDVARRGILELVTIAENEADGSEDRVKLGIYTFSNTLKAVVPIDSSVASDFGEIRKRVTGITLGQEEGGSNIMAAVNEIGYKITKVGDGSSSDRPKVFVLLVSDGVANSTLFRPRADGGFNASADEKLHFLSPSTFGAIQNPRSADVTDAPNASQITAGGITQVDAGRLGAMDDRVCGPIKQRGVTMLVIETEYVLPPNGSRNKVAGKDGDDYRFLWFETGGRLRTISDRMRDCATRDHFASVKDGPAFRNALVLMGELALKSTLRLTN